MQIIKSVIGFLACDFISDKKQVLPASVFYLKCQNNCRGCQLAKKDIKPIPDRVVKERAKVASSLLKEFFIPPKSDSTDYSYSSVTAVLTGDVFACKDLPDFISFLKDLYPSVWIHTCGFSLMDNKLRPTPVLDKVINYVDTIAIEIKAPIDLYLDATKLQGFSDKIEALISFLSSLKEGKEKFLFRVSLSRIISLAIKKKEKPFVLIKEIQIMADKCGIPLFFEKEIFF